MFVGELKAVRVTHRTITVDEGGYIPVVNRWRCRVRLPVDLCRREASTYIGGCLGHWERAGREVGVKVRRGWRTAGLVAAAGTALLAGATVWLVRSADDTVTLKPAASSGTSVTPGGSATPGSNVVSELSAADLVKVARTRVFFGHQSVGRNVLGGVSAVYAAHGVQAPSVERRRDASGMGAGFIVHTSIGQNQNPQLKIEDFDSLIRGGLGTQVDVAMMKFCYVDVSSGTDVEALFRTYRDTMAALERDFPRVAFVKVTVPLTTEPEGLSNLKGRLTGGPGAVDNAARERLNELIRKEYGGDDLFDLAAVESTAPDGSRLVGTYQGKEFYALYGGYASDNGHLNAEGSRRAATAWLRAVAEASSK